MKSNLPPGCTTRDIEQEHLAEEMEREEMNFWDNVEGAYDQEKEKSLLIGMLWLINGLLVGFGLACFAFA